MRKSRLVSPLKRLGGKANLAKWIIYHLPFHESYIEVFGGSAPVLLSKSRCKGQEVYNDLDGLWANTWLCLRDHNQKLADLIQATPYSRAEFEQARKKIREWRNDHSTIDPVELARCHMVVIRQSYSADGSWSRTNFDGGGRPTLWARLPETISARLQRMRGIYIEQRDYTDILRTFDHERATFYLDPPYQGVENRYYDVNRTDGFDHKKLRDVVDSLKGSVVVSYYARTEIEELYAGWETVRHTVLVHSGDQQREETELLFIRSSAFGKRPRPRRRIKVDLFAEAGAVLL